LEAIKVDLSLLLSPISHSSIEGEDISYDTCLDAIKQARTQEDARFSQGVWERDVKKADWQEVASRCYLLLQTRTKDLTLALWLGQALIEQAKDFKTFSLVCDFITTFCERFFEEMYPKGEERLEKLEGLFSWFLTFLQESISLKEFTPPLDEAPRGYSLYNLQQAQKIEHLLKSQKESKKLLEEAKKKGDLLVDDFHKSLRKIAPLTAKELNEALNDIKTSFSKLQNFLDDHLDKNAPSFSVVMEQIRDIQTLITPFIREELHSPTPVEEQSTQPSASIEMSMNPTLEKKREDLYKQLESIATELSHLEPHSPTPQILKEIRKWESKTLGDIINFFGPQDFTLLLKKFGIVT
jgi:type VI secretion system protein ImpA